MFVATAETGTVPRLHLMTAVHAAFDGPAAFLADPAHRAQVTAYLSDLARTGGRTLSAEPDGPSYGEMAEALIEAAVPGAEPVDVLILAHSVHDVRPNRQTAAYLSHVTPGEPMAFAICDQGPAAAFTGLRIARDYGARRALLVIVEQGTLPYDCPAPLPDRAQGVALLLGTGPGAAVTGIAQHPALPPERVAAQAGADLDRLTAGHGDATLILGTRLAEVWPATGARIRVAPAGQPDTGVWVELERALGGATGPVVAADYDPALRYLCLAAFDVA